MAMLTVYYLTCIDRLCAPEKDAYLCGSSYTRLGHLLGRLSDFPYSVYPTFYTSDLFLRTDLLRFTSIILLSCFCLHYSSYRVYIQSIFRISGSLMMDRGRSCEEQPSEAEVEEASLSVLFTLTE